MPLAPARARGRPAPTKRHRWTADDLAYLRLHYDGTKDSVRRAAADLGVSQHSAYSKIRLMGLCRSKGPNWTPEEDARLREMVGRRPVRAIAKTLMRTVNGVAVRIKRLGLSTRVRDGWYTARDVAQIIGVDHKVIARRIDDGVLRASYHHGRRPTKDGQAAWHIAEADLHAYIRRYPQDLTRRADLMQLVEVLAGILPEPRP